MRFPTNTQWDAMIQAHPDPKPTPMVRCETCKGRKYVVRKRPGYVTQKGTMVTGRVTFATCPTCDGVGEVEQGEMEES